MIKCGFCGYEFDENSREAAGCRGCPMSGRCGKIKCPRCGFENVRQSGLFKWMKNGRKSL
ncbi:hypothetical protein [Thermoanaerobacterium sp. DL9XJH110]|uniref:hypothetical protein n=1 Tax=Thermoanaerobacterium sp. DL9XJH110 TaxID=3386643 RepID=UPI003BB502EB